MAVLFKHVLLSLSFHSISYTLRFFITLNDKVENHRPYLYLALRLNNTWKSGGGIRTFGCRCPYIAEIVAYLTYKNLENVQKSFKKLFFMIDIYLLFLYV